MSEAFLIILTGLQSLVLGKSAPAPAPPPVNPQHIELTSDRWKEEDGMGTFPLVIQISCSAYSPVLQVCLTSLLSSQQTKTQITTNYLGLSRTCLRGNNIEKKTTTLS